MNERDLKKKLFHQAKEIYPITTQEKQCATERFFRGKMREEWIKKRLIEISKEKVSEK